MGKSQNNIGWTEATTYLKELQEHSSGHPHLFMEVVGTGMKLRLQVTLTLAVPLLVGPAQYLYLQADGCFPSVDYTSMAALVWSLCHRIDTELSSRFVQLGLEETAN